MLISKIRARLFERVTWSKGATPSHMIPSYLRKRRRKRGKMKKNRREREKEKKKGRKRKN
ncbi:hypothetical protein L345_09411, partial [Ophiophagus hannah]